MQTSLFHTIDRKEVYYRQEKNCQIIYGPVQHKFLSE